MEKPDRSKLPQSTWTIQDVLSFEVVYAIAGFNRYLERSARIEQFVQQDIEALRREWEASTHPAADEHGFDPVADEQIWAAEIDRGMYALLAIAIAARMEEWYFKLCENRHLQYRTKQGKTNIDIARKSLQKVGIDFERLNGFPDYQKAAFMAHKFKHNAGLADSEFSAKYDTPEGEPIEYETEDWPKIIKSVAAYLDELCQLFMG
jgi:hypothetical protein